MTINNERIFNPSPEDVGKKVISALNQQYDVLVESDNSFQVSFRYIKREDD